MRFASEARRERLTIGQLDRRRVGVDSRKDTPISYIRMGDQRDWFPVRTNGTKRDPVNFFIHVAGLIVLTGVF